MKYGRMLSLILAAFTAMLPLASCGTAEQGTNAPETAGSPAPADTDASAPEAPDAATEDPLWDYGQVAFGGAGYVTGVYSTNEKDLYYAKTDVGGAYRWDSGEKKWVSLNYWVSEDDRGYLGIDGLAVDPNDASKLYLLAGTEYFSNGRTALLKSTDYGKSFKVIDLTELIRVHGNGMGRGNGERIAVDPNNTDVIFAGGRTGGLIKSTDAGETWTPAESFPVTFTPNSNGINCLLFDPSSVKDGVTQRIYAAVSRKGDDNIFVSEDAGASWKPLPAADTKYMPQRMKLDQNGALYVTYGSEEGPWNQANGGVFRYENGSAESIAPNDRPFGDILIHPDDPDKLLLVTTQTWVQQPNGAYGDTFYVSTDRGASWDDIISKMTMTADSSDWIKDCAIHWCSCLMGDPFDASKIMVNSGNGIFACDNIWDDAPAFYFNSFGIEECVPLDIISLENDPLMVSIGDYSGFISEDVTVPGERLGGDLGSVCSITVAALNRDYRARLGDGDKQSLSYSTDGGKTWQAIKRGPEKGKSYSGGRIAFNADGSRLLWAPAKCSSVYYTDDFGQSWNVCEGLIGMGIYIIGDMNSSDHFYALGSGAFVSSDGGKTFERVSGIFDPSGTRICVDPHEAGTFYVPDLMGLYKVTEFGKKVETVQNVRSCEVMSLGKAKSDGEPLTMYVMGIVDGGNGKRIYMSDDNGATWTAVNDDAHLFGGTGNGKFISGDMNVYGRCYMSTVGMGLIYCELRT